MTAAAARGLSSRALIRWSRLHAKRERISPWRSPWLATTILACAFAAGVDVGPTGTWIAGACLLFGVACLRVPFHVYWRRDAALLAQLPIGGGALYDAALARCAIAGVETFAIAALGALPIAIDAPALAPRLLAFIAAFASAVALAMPAVVVGTAALVAGEDEGGAVAAMRSAAGVATAPSARGSTALLGAVPGVAGAALLVVLIRDRPWIRATELTPDASLHLLALAFGSPLLALLARPRAAAAMGRILRDVSALDRQRLATLEIHPPTAIERAIAALLGDGAVIYRKDARLVRRRYPLAFALGAIVFLTIAIASVVASPTRIAVIAMALAGAALYALMLARRVATAPIEVERLRRTLPIAVGAIHRAKVAWVAGWWTVFVAVPGVFAAVRVADDVVTGALLATTVVVLAGAAIANRV